MATREWFRGFFDDTYLEILTAQKSTRRTRAEVDFLTKALRLKPGGRVLDVPCGFGRHARLTNQTLARQPPGAVHSSATNEMPSSASLS